MMKKCSIIKSLIPSVLMSLALFGCLSVAKISSFPKTSSEINFEEYSTDYRDKKDPFRTSSTSNEYYFEHNKAISEEVLTKIIKNALKERGYEIYSISLEDDVVFGKRGMYANEWNSITAVYYHLDAGNQKLQCYISTQITQDFTGGWRENRAKKVGLLIETQLDSAN